MSSTFTSFSSGSVAVSAPASRQRTSSIRKQVVRCLGSSPPWQPKTCSLTLEVSELPLHLQVLKKVVQPRRVVDRHPIAAALDQPRPLQLVEHEADRRLPEAYLP